MASLSRRAVQSVALASHEKDRRVDAHAAYLRTWDTNNIAATNRQRPPIAEFTGSDASRDRVAREWQREERYEDEDTAEQCPCGHFRRCGSLLCVDQRGTYRPSGLMVRGCVPKGCTGWTGSGSKSLGARVPCWPVYGFTFGDVDQLLL